MSWVCRRLYDIIIRLLSEQNAYNLGKPFGDGVVSGYGDGNNGMRDRVKWISWYNASEI